MFKKGDREDSGNYRGLTLLSVIAKSYSRVINNHMLNFLESNNKLNEGQGGFRKVDPVVIIFFPLMS